jgi:hydrogenase-4 membrane subunit HyfE
MMVLLVAILIAIIAPLFARTWRVMFRMLGLQGLLLAIIAYQNLAHHIDDIAVWVLLADLVVLRGLFVPAFLHRMVADRTRSPELELVPSNLVFWGISVGVMITALWFGAKIPPVDTLPSLHLGVALTAVLLGLYVLTLQTRPIGQVIAAITIENGVVLLELLLKHHVALPVELALSAVFLMSLIAFGFLLRRLEAAEAAEAAPHPDSEDA